MDSKFTVMAADALKLAKRTARSLKLNYVGTEHILMGLILEDGSVASRILIDNGIDENRMMDNDYGFERLFARQIEAQGCAGDVFIGISTSGKSKNLVEALAACKAKGITSVAIVGADPCPMDEYDYVIHVPSHSTPRIQECQTLIGHVLCYLVEQVLFGA